MRIAPPPAGHETLLALDPGLDDLGWAVYRCPVQRLATLNLNAYAALYVDAGTVYTKTTEPLAERLGRLAEAVRTISRRYLPSLVVVEAPAIEGQYGRHAARGGHRLNALALRRNAQAAGAVLAAAARDRVVVQEVRALARRGGKEESQETVRLAFGARLPRGSEHMRDALALGLRVLMDDRRRLVPGLLGAGDDARSH